MKEAPRRAHTKKNTEDGNGIRVNAQTSPHERKHQPNWASEVNIEPFLGIIRFETGLQELAK